MAIARPAPIVNQRGVTMKRLLGLAHHFPLELLARPALVAEAIDVIDDNFRMELLGCGMLHLIGLRFAACAGANYNENNVATMAALENLFYKRRLTCRKLPDVHRNGTVATGSLPLSPSGTTRRRRRIIGL